VTSVAPKAIRAARRPPAGSLLGTGGVDVGW